MSNHALMNISGKRSIRIIAAVSALLAGTSVVAQAAPSSTSVQAASSTSATEQAVSAPISAASSTMALALTSDAAVEDLSQRTETTKLFANPDGTWTSKTAAEPEQVQDAAGDWHAIDTDLTERSGVLVPRYAASDLELSNGGDTTFAAVTEGGKDLEWRWPNPLPTPTVVGSTATYHDVVPHGDLVVTATITGFEHSVVLRERPAGPLEITTPIVTDGANLVDQAASGVAVKTDAGATVVNAPGPLMWDSSENSQGDPDKVSPVATSVGENAAGTDTLTLSPDTSFLADPATQYPVTVDPSFSVGTFGDTWVQNAGYTTSQVTSDELRAGTYDSGTHKARSFIKFDVAQVVNTRVLSANMVLRNFSSNSCTASAIRAEPVNASWILGDLTWANQPAVDATKFGDYSPARGYNSSCVGGDATWDVTPLAQGWADGSVLKQGVRLKAVNETSNASWRLYRAGNYGAPTVPQLNVTYTTAPSVPVLGLSDCVAPCDPEWRVTRSLVPTLQATAADPNDSTLAYSWELRTEDQTTVLATGSASGAQGQPASWQVPTGTLAADTSYEFRVGASDGSTTTWSAWSVFGVALDDATAAPTELSVSPCQGTCATTVSTSRNPVLSARLQDADWDMLGARFEVRAQGASSLTATSSDLETPSGAAALFKLPTDSLTNNGAYEFRVGSINDTGVTWSTWKQFTVQLPLGPSEAKNVALSSCSGACSEWRSSTTRPTFVAERSDSLAATTDIKFEISGANYTYTGTNVGVAPSAAASWTVPAGELASEVEYQLRVGVTQNGVTTWTGRQTFSVDGAVAVDEVALPQAEFVEGTSTVNPAPDTNDTADTKAAHPYNVQDVYAIDNQVSQDTQNALLRGDNPDAAATQRTVSIPVKYAPVMTLHPDEPYGPMSASTFIHHSMGLIYDHGNCHPDFVTGDRPPSGTKLGNGTYTHREKAANCVDHVGTLYKSTDIVNPGGDGGPPNYNGMYLDLDPDYQDGGGLQGEEPVFYKYVPNVRITYWFNWGYSKTYWKTSGGASTSHEGDWERIAIKLDSNNKPTRAQYFYHKSSCTIPWTKAPLLNTHPKVWVAKGSHGSYPAGAVAPRLGFLGFHHDAISGAGESWNGVTNATNVDSLAWYGFGGGWGNAGGEFTSGPSGPNPHRNPPSFSSDPCKFS